MKVIDSDSSCYDTSINPDVGNTETAFEVFQAQIADIQTKLERLELTLRETQEQLYDLLYHTREQLLRRDDEIQATIYEMGIGLAQPSQPSAPTSGSRVKTEVFPRPPGYGDLIDRVRDIVSSTVKSGSIIIVVSRGDERLLEFDNAQGWHFPQASSGVYAGYHPRDSEEAIQHLEELRSRGGKYLLVPATATWWLDFYREFRVHLERRYCEVAREQKACVLYDLDGKNRERR